MKTLTAPRPGRQENSTPQRLSLDEAARYAEGLPVEACIRCQAPIIWAREHGGGRMAVEVLPGETGHVGIETSLIKGGGGGLSAYVTSLATHFGRHADRCLQAFVADARPRKGRP